MNNEDIDKDIFFFLKESFKDMGELIEIEKVLGCEWKVVIKTKDNFCIEEIWKYEDNLNILIKSWNIKDSFIDIVLYCGLQDCNWCIKI